MTDKIKKTRTPKNAESILKGASKLPLREKVDLIKALQEQVHIEVDQLKQEAAAADTIANGLG